MKELLTYDQILNESRWVAKMQGYRVSGTYAEVKHYADDEDCRDFDLSAQQPEHLKGFFDAYWAYDEEHGFITLRDFYTIYAQGNLREAADEDEMEVE